MDVASTFFANLMTIFLALQDKSLSFHFAKNLDFDELYFFERTSVVCRHRLVSSITMGPMNLFIRAVKKYDKIKSSKLDFLP